MTENKDINYSAMVTGGFPNNMSSAKVIVPLIYKAVNPKSVIDIGCGIGVWLSEFKKNGVEVINGVDGEWVLKNKLLIDRENIEICDFENKDQRVHFIENKKYDLAVCLEMAEHVSYGRADYIVETLTKASDVVYFSGATPYSGGMHHVNEQWQTYWTTKFSNKGFVVIDYIRPKVWNNRNVCYFYAEESFIFVKKERIEEFPLLKKEIRDDVIYNMVHPIHFKDQIIKPTHDWAYLLSMQKKLLNAYIEKAKCEWQVKKKYCCNVNSKNGRRC